MGAGLMIIDTLGQFAGFEGDEENNAGDMLAAVQPLQVAAAEGIAVAFARHERKASGRVGDAGRGSSALTGAVDVVLSLRQPEGNQPATVREIQALSRFDETPGRLIVELTKDGYVSHGSESSCAKEGAKQAILES
jgi:hypothetical protein